MLTTLICQELHLHRSSNLQKWCQMIKVKIPDLLKKNKMNATDLMRKANIAYITALRLSKGDAQAITFEVLESLCKLFDAKVEDILEYIPDSKK